MSWKQKIQDKLTKIKQERQEKKEIDAILAKEKYMRDQELLNKQKEAELVKKQNLSIKKEIREMKQEQFKSSGLGSFLSQKSAATTSKKRKPLLKTKNKLRKKTIKPKQPASTWATFKPQQDVRSCFRVPKKNTYFSWKK